MVAKVLLQGRNCALQAHCCMPLAPVPVSNSDIMDRNLASYQTNFRFRFVEYMTCTDSRQAWGRSKAEITQWRAKPVLQLCCVRKHPPVCSSEAPNKRELLQQEFNRILRGNSIPCPCISYYTHMLQRRNVGVIFSSFFCNVPTKTKPSVVFFQLFHSY